MHHYLKGCDPAWIELVDVVTQAKLTVAVVAPTIDLTNNILFITKNTEQNIRTITVKISVQLQLQWHWQLD